MVLNKLSHYHIVNVYILVLIVILTERYTIAEAPSTLRLAHIVFRHGDRSPTETFPTDKHQENSWPQGFSQLTQLGMRQEFELGKVLRGLYNGFLNSTYIRKQVYMRSTDKDRTLMSASMCLAGLYPPHGHQIWNESINWQPIPVHTVNVNNDNLLFVDLPCDPFNPMLEDVYSSTEVLQYINDNKEFLDMVRRESGLPDADLYTIMETVPNPIFCENIHNLSLPTWVTDEVFQKLLDLKTFQVKLWFYTPEMQKIRAGVFLHELVNHTRMKVSGKLDDQMKVYLYSAHDTTLTASLIALRTWDGLIPAYASVMMFELHQRPDQSYFVRLRYKNDTIKDTVSEPVTLSIRGCEHDCNLERFYDLVQPMVYEGDWFKDCGHLSTATSHFAGVPLIAIAVCILLLMVLLVIIVTICYRRKTGGIAYQSANFTPDTTTA